MSGFRWGSDRLDFESNGGNVVSERNGLWKKAGKTDSNAAHFDRGTDCVANRVDSPIIDTNDVGFSYF
jgi:hypothetical protein